MKSCAPGHTESGELGNTQELSYQGHAPGHNAALPFNATEWRVVSVSPEQGSAEGFHIDPVPMCPSSSCGSNIAVTVSMSLASWALNMLIDLCEDTCQSKTTKYVVFNLKHVDDSWRSWDNLSIDYVYMFP